MTVGQNVLWELFNNSNFTDLNINCQRSCLKCYKQIQWLRFLFCHCLKGKTSRPKEITEGLEGSSDDRKCLAKACHSELTEEEDCLSSKTVFPTQKKHNTGGK